MHVFLVTAGLAAAAAAPPAAVPAPAMRPIEDVAGRYGFPKPVPVNASVALCSPYTTMAFTPGSREMVLNGTRVMLNAPVAESDGRLMLACADVETVLDPLLRASRALRGRRMRTVVIDPGHGGADSGAISPRRLLEKKATLDIAQRVSRRLTAAGLAALLTRSRDEDLALAERTGLATRWKADLLVSIHLNSSGNPAAEGIETYVLPHAGFGSTSNPEPDGKAYAGNAADGASTLLGYYVHRGVLAETRATDRGVRRARYQVLRDAPCPAALVECGFVSNRKEEQALLRADYREALAEGIARGILTVISKTP